MKPSAAKPDPHAVSFVLKRGTLLGAAMGMLAGLLFLSIFGGRTAAEVADIVFWRNCILIGAAAGFLLGGIIAWRFRDRLEVNPEQTPRDPSRIDERKPTL